MDSCQGGKWKGKGKSKGKKGKETGGEIGKGKSNNRKKNWWHEHHDQRVNGTVPWFLWSLLEMGSQQGPVPSLAGEPMELGAMVSHSSQNVVSESGSSVSKRVHAMNSPVCGSESVDDEEDWPVEWWHDLESDRMEDWQDDWYWHDS